ncbi:Spy/CpxP family protein refolding chaperone [Cellvibrio sp. pealriver]|uniref:Spy/CpxP family protein refolding chaperone n=1 Tax=Cellvibrio sp. pealriver TaxID=1622269 RepID=UPI00066FED15|nr:Spy/CpxP family protein refolding chaperone [Cellvibrio sp. pealriver]
MKSITLLSVGVVLLSAASVMPAMAGSSGKHCDVKHHIGQWGGHDGMGERELRHLRHALDLTDEQKATLASQRDTNKAEREALHAKLSGARAALTTAVESGANDAELAVLADTLGKLQAEQVLAGLKARQAFFAILTDEQKAKMAELKTKRMERKKELKSERKETQSS